MVPDPKRTRKLLLNKSELSRLVGSVERKGYTLVPLDLHWKDGRAKLEIGLAKGKKQHDKRATEKDRDWSTRQGAYPPQELTFAAWEAQRWVVRLGRWLALAPLRSHWLCRARARVHAQLAPPLPGAATGRSRMARFPR